MVSQVLAWALLAGAFDFQALPPVDEWSVADRPILALGAVEGDRPDLFGTVAGAVRFDAGEVVVADQMAADIRVFSADGALLGRAGGRGEGPGEFRTIMSMRRCAASAVFVYDPASFRLSVFDSDGSLVRTAPVMEGGPPPYDFFCNREGILAYVHRSVEPPAGVGPRRPNVAVTVSYPAGEDMKLGVFPASERYFDGTNDFPRPLGKRTSIAIGSDALYLGTGDYAGDGNAFEIPVYSFRGERIGVIRDTVSRREVTERHIRALVEDQVNRSKDANRQRRVRRLLESVEYPETYPAYSRLTIDPDDNLWVEEYPPPGQQIRTWRVYSRAGRRIGTVRLPRNFRLLEAGDDYVLGVREDGLGVDFVEVYRLIKPSSSAAAPGTGNGTGP